MEKVFNEAARVVRSPAHWVCGLVTLILFGIVVKILEIGAPFVVYGLAMAVGIPFGYLVEKTAGYKNLLGKILED